VAENTNDPMVGLSAALAQRAAEARPFVAAIGVPGHSWHSGILWRDGIVVTSEQALPRAQEADIVLADGEARAGRLAGRDPGSNLAVLRLDGAAPAPGWTAAAAPQPAALVLALGSDDADGVAARLGAIHKVGPEWHSRAGGRIDSRIELDMRLGHGEEGGPVVDASGGLLGMSTLGPRRQVLVIPTATIERALEPLLATGRIARGWLGAAVQRVELPEALHAASGQSHGLIVLSVAEGGPAARAGVLVGDILLALAGRGLAGTRRLAELLGPEAVGQELGLRLIRAGAMHDLKVTVAERPLR
jgi:S1-C subfamily serine protease